jgi:Caspase domain/Sel1 repeat/MORN repeat
MTSRWKSLASALGATCLSISAHSAVTNLPPCGGTDVAAWDQCVGETQVQVGDSTRTYRGEFQKGLPHGRGIRFGLSSVKDKDGRIVASLGQDGKPLEITTVGHFQAGKLHGQARVTRSDGTSFLGEVRDERFVKGEDKYFVTYSTGLFGTGKTTELLTYIGTYNEKQERDGEGLIYDAKQNLVFCGNFDNDKPRYQTNNRELQRQFEKNCEDSYKRSRDFRSQRDPSSAEQQNLPLIEAYVNQQLALKARLAQPAARLVDPLGSEIVNCPQADIVLKQQANASRDRGPASLQAWMNMFGGRKASQLGYVHLLGCPPQMAVDLEEAVYWIDLAAKAKDPAAMHNLAWMYQNGYGVPRDDTRAASLYLTLADSADRSPIQRRAARDNLALIAPDIVQAAAPLPAPQPAAPVAPAMPVAAPVTVTPAPVIAAEPPARAPATASVAGPGKRRALVIGNDSYKGVPALQNAREDARAMAEQFRALGYEVTLGLDLTERAMKRTLRTFADQVQGGDEVVFFFAGHGVQLGPANYLLPVDIAGESEGQVRDESIPLQRVLDDLSERKARFTLAVLDACRDNPFKSAGRSIGGRGLAATTAATGQMVIFSAGVGQQALDRVGPADKSRNGLFTRVFLKEVQKPGLTIDKVVRNVRNEVVETARRIGHEQVPAIYDQVVGEFYFRK